jgi:hypothetical protein
MVPGAPAQSVLPYLEHLGRRFSGCTFLTR